MTHRRHSETIDGVWCHPEGGSRIETVPLKTAVKIDSRNGEVWMAKRADGAHVLHQNGETHPTTREVCENVLEGHDAEDVATLPISRSPFEEADQ